MTYNLDGDVLSAIDPDGHEITYSYDADNELTGETWVNPAGGTPIDVFHFTYNSDGELTAVSDDNSAYQYTYNADGEETSQADVGSPDLPTVTLTYDYDADGNRTAMDDSLGGLVSYAYNARDELTNETLSGTDISAIAVANTYDNAGNMTGQTRYSNLAETTVVATTSYTYDDANQMTGITDKNSSGTTLVSYGYTFNAAGLVTQETRTWDSGADTDTLGYTYTNNDQLTGVTHTDDAFANESFSYDANGNETGTGYTTSTGNEQTASPGNTYTYDADGNMITDTITSTGDVWTYAYNFNGQMTGAIEKNSDDTVIAQATYTYDALGNRIGMDENGTQTRTLYDGNTPIMDFNSSGSLEMRYLNGPTGQLVDSVLARESAGGTVAWYLPDRLGTVRDLINNSGSIIDHIDFSAFGTMLDQSDASNGDRMMGFGGMELDSVTGMNLAVYRVQNPGTGRWTSQDPLGFGGGDADLYRYAGNGPSNGADPGGEALGPILWGGGVILAGAGLYVYDWDVDSLSREQQDYVNELTLLLNMAAANCRESVAHKYLEAINVIGMFNRDSTEGRSVSKTRNGSNPYSFGWGNRTILSRDFFFRSDLDAQLRTLLHESWHSGTDDLNPEHEQRAYDFADAMLRRLKCARSYRGSVLRLERDHKRGRFGGGIFQAR